MRHIFGVPGVQLDYAVDGLARLPEGEQIAYWNTRHEQATSYMADGYARVKRAGLACAWSFLAPAC